MAAVKHSKKILLSPIVLLLVCPKCFSQSQAQQTESKPLQIGVRLYNDARVPDAQVRAAEEVAARVLRQAGIEAEWSDCTVIGGQVRNDPPSCAVPLRFRDMVVYFVDRLEAHFLWVSQNALGYSIIPDTHEFASMAYVSYPRIQKLSASTSAGVEDLLGLAMAHEIGHLLFGSNQHANQGIMRATWRLRDLEAKAWDEFQFTQNQRKQLRVGVEARRQADQLRAMAQNNPHLINAVVSMGRRNTQLEPILHENKTKSLARIDLPERYLARFLPSTAKQCGSPGEVFSDQLIRWCCIDRLSWHDLPGT